MAWQWECQLSKQLFLRMNIISKTRYKKWYVPTPYSHWNDGVSHLNISGNSIKYAGNIDCQVLKQSTLLGGSWYETINLQTI